MFSNVMMRTLSSRAPILSATKSAASKVVQRKTLHGSKQLEAVWRDPQRIRIRYKHRVMAIGVLAFNAAGLYFTIKYEDEINNKLGTNLVTGLPMIIVASLTSGNCIRILTGCTFIVGTSVI